jgi:hypothetical protein
MEPRNSPENLEDDINQLKHFIDTEDINEIYKIIYKYDYDDINDDLLYAAASYSYERTKLNIFEDIINHLQDLDEETKDEDILPTQHMGTLINNIINNENIAILNYMINANFLFTAYQIKKMYEKKFHTELFKILRNNLIVSSDLYTLYTTNFNFLYEIIVSIIKTLKLNSQDISYIFLSMTMNYRNKLLTKIIKDNAIDPEKINHLIYENSLMFISFISSNTTDFKTFQKVFLKGEKFFNDLNVYIDFFNMNSDPDKLKFIEYHGYIIPDNLFYSGKIFKTQDVYVNYDDIFKYLKSTRPSLNFNNIYLITLLNHINSKYIKSIAIDYKKIDIFLIYKYIYITQKEYKQFNIYNLNEFMYDNETKTNIYKFYTINKKLNKFNRKIFDFIGNDEDKVNEYIKKREQFLLSVSMIPEKTDIAEFIKKCKSNMDIITGNEMDVKNDDTLQPIGICRDDEPRNIYCFDKTQLIKGFGQPMFFYEENNRGNLYSDNSTVYKMIYPNYWISQYGLIIFLISSMKSFKLISIGEHDLGTKFGMSQWHGGHIHMVYDMVENNIL